MGNALATLDRRPLPAKAAAIRLGCWVASFDGKRPFHFRGLPSPVGQQQHTGIYTWKSTVGQCDEVEHELPGS